MAVSIDALAGIAAIEDAREAQEPGPVEIVSKSNPVTRGLKWGMDYLNPTKQASGGLISNVMGVYEKSDAAIALAEEEFDKVLRDQAREEAYERFSTAWSDERFQSWADKYGEALMVDDFITDVSLPDQDDLISTSAYNVPGTGDTIQEMDMLNQRFDSSPINLNQQKSLDKLSFYLDDEQMGMRYQHSPYDFRVDKRGDKTRWDLNYDPSSLLSPEQKENSWLDTKVGVNKVSGENISPYADVSFNRIPGLNLNVHAQRDPGMNVNMFGGGSFTPSMSYEHQFKTPIGPLDFSASKRYGDDWRAYLQYKRGF